MNLTERIAAEASGDVPFPFGRESDGTGRADLALILTEAEVVERFDDPTGHIIVDGEPMAYWLPAGVSAESIGIPENGVDGRLRGHDGERV